MYKKYLKRIIDFILSFVLIIALSPICLLISLAIKVETKGPVLFTQNRIGKYQKLFSIYKFRTMIVETPKNSPTHLLESPEMYITKVGSFLRKTSLDELPQLLNVLRGEMSFIGPRPALWNQYDLINEREKRRVHEVLPGLTGWAQINGRDNLEILTKAQLDSYYVDRISFLFDIRCFFITIWYVLKRTGVIEGKII